MKKTENKAEMFRAAAELLDNAPRYKELLIAEAERIEKSYERARNTESKAHTENVKVAEQVAKWFEEDAEKGYAYDGQSIQEALGLDVTPQKFAAIIKLVEGVEKVEKADSNKNRVGYLVKSV